MTAALPKAVVEAHRVVQQYGEALENSSGMVRNEKLLPAPKETIKAALFILLQIEKDEQQRAILIGGYVYLAHFQALTDAELVALEQYEKTAEHANLTVGAGAAEQKSALLSVLTMWPLYKIIVERRFEEEAALTEELSANGIR